MNDPLEQTTPPGAGVLRCTSHEQLVTQIAKIDSKVDTAIMLIKDTRAEMKEQIHELSRHDQSVNGHIRDLQSVSAVRSGGIKVLTWAIPLAATALLSFSGLVVAVLKLILG